ncbi:hypothetical protein LCGC14_0194690 [marine sediment metagenome]|uniref:LamG-like jellyroll fold domain-containing protein n=1 Tax=marine sediment metagenome TaxID=412755 RepID=A0A0F9V1N8_9ZZZZ
MNKSKKNKVIAIICIALFTISMLPAELGGDKLREAIEENTGLDFDNSLINSVSGATDPLICGDFSCSTGWTLQNDGYGVPTISGGVLDLGVGDGHSTAYQTVGYTVAEITALAFRFIEDWGQIYARFYYVGGGYYTYTFPPWTCCVFRTGTFNPALMDQSKSINQFRLYNTGTTTENWYGVYIDYFTISVDSTAPVITTPSGTTQEYATTGTFSINWLSTDNFNLDEVYVDDSAGGYVYSTSSDYYDLAITGTSDTFTTTWNKNAFLGIKTYRGRVYDIVGLYDTTTDVSVTIQDTTNPDVTSYPSNSNCEYASTGTCSIGNWVATDLLPSQYKIQRKLGSGGTYADVRALTAWASGTPYTFDHPKNLALGNVYYYKTYFVDTSTNSAWSTENTVTMEDTTTPTQTARPSTPRDVEYASSGTTTLSFWTGSDYLPSQYRVMRDFNSGGYAQVQGWTAWTSSSQQVTFEHPDTLALGTYKYRVEWKDTTGNTYTSSSMEITVNQQDTTDPIVTSYPSNTNVEYASSGVYTLSNWIATDLLASQYRIMRQFDGGGYAEVRTWTTWVSGNSYTYDHPKNLALGSYDYYAEFRDTTPNTVQSTVTVITQQDTTNPIVTVAQGDINVEYASSGTTQLSWTATDLLADDYQLERQFNSGGYSVIVAYGNGWTSGVATTYAHQRNLALGSYDYRITFKDTSSLTAQDVATITQQDTTSPVVTQYPSDIPCEYASSGICNVGDWIATDYFASQYKIEWNGTGTGWVTFQDWSSWTSGNSYSINHDKTLALGSYQYRAVFKDQQTLETTSGVTTITQQDTTNPIVTAIPSNSSVEYSASGTTTITYWTGGDLLPDSYMIYRQYNGGGYSAITSWIAWSSNTTQITFQHDNTLPLGLYDYYIVFRDTSLNTVNSDATGVTQEDTTDPISTNIPTDYTTEYATSGVYALEFWSGTDLLADEYQIERQYNSGGWGVIRAYTTWVSGNQYSINFDLSESIGTYEYRVTYKDTSTNTVVSPITTITHQDTEVPTVDSPSDQIYESGDTDSRSITWIFGDNYNGKDYDIYRSTDNSTWGSPIYSDTWSGLSGSAIQSVGSQTVSYYYKIEVFDSSDNMILDIVFVEVTTIINPVISHPSDTSYETGDPSTHNVVWIFSDEYGGLDWNIKRSTDNSSWGGILLSYSSSNADGVYTHNVGGESLDYYYLFSVTDNAFHTVTDVVFVGTWATLNLKSFSYDTPATYSDMLAYYPLDNDVLDYSGNGYDGTKSTNTDLLAHYKMENALDSSGNGYDLTPNGDATHVSGKLNNAGKVTDAGNGRWSRALTTEFDSLSAYSVAFWMRYLDIPVNYHDIIHISGSTGSARTLDFYIDANYLTTSFYDDGTSQYKSTSVPLTSLTLDTDQLWHYLATSWDGTYLRIYVDGVLIATSSDYSAFTVGQLPTGLSIGDNQFDAEFDDVRILNRALDLDEIIELYNGEIGTEDDLDNYVAGTISNAMRFGGTSDSIEVALPDSLRTNGISFSLWTFHNVVGTSNSGFLSFMTDGETSDDDGIWFHVNDNQILWRVEDQTNGETAWVQTITTLSNTWYHWVFVFELNSQKIYRNNSLLVEYTKSFDLTDLRTDNSLRLLLGETYLKNSYFHDGLIDEVRIFNKAISTDYIDNLYNLGHGLYDTDERSLLFWNGYDADGVVSYALNRNSIQIANGTITNNEYAYEYFNDGGTIASGIYEFDLILTSTNGVNATHQIDMNYTDAIPHIYATPSIFDFGYGATGNRLQWNVVDNYPSTYIIYKNGTSIQSGSWSADNTLFISLDNLIVGTYNFTIEVFDAGGNSNVDTKIINVLSNAILIETPSDLMYALATTENTLTWLISDYVGGTYQLYRNSVSVDTGSWTSNVDLIINIDGLAIDLYNYTLVITDAQTINSTDMVWVSVQAEDGNPIIIITPDDFSYNYASTENVISWGAVDNFPATYNITMDGELVQEGLWDSSEFIAILVDGLGIGVYTFILYVYDTSGNVVSDTVIVSVI